MNDKQPTPIQVDPEALSAEALRGVIESFVLREGTDYGSVELSLEQKIKNLNNKIQKKDIVLVFDSESESLTFLTKAEWQKINK
ncbi:MAG: YheU family protein [Pseudobdellovibrio sp.]